MNLETMLDALADRAGSDRKAAPLLGITHSAFSAWRTGRSFPDDDQCRKIGELLSRDPAYVMAVVRAQRAKTKETRETWQRVAQAFASVLVTVGAVTAIGVTPGTAQARFDITPIGGGSGGQRAPQGGQRASGAGPEYTLRRQRRRGRTAGALLHATARALGLTGPRASVA